MPLFPSSYPSGGAPLISNENFRCAHEASVIAYLHPSQYSAHYSKADSNTLYIAFPGTSISQDLDVDADCAAVDLPQASFPGLEGKVHSGFLRRFTDNFGFAGSAASELPSIVTKAEGHGHQVVFVGHSLGGAIAKLATCWALVHRARDSKGPAPLCITFGAPLVAATALAGIIDEKWGRQFYHVVNRRDIVPRVLVAPEEGWGNIRALAKDGLSRVAKSLPGRAWRFISRAPPTSVEITAAAENARLAERLGPQLTEERAEHWLCKVAAVLHAAPRGAQGISGSRVFAPFGTYIIHQEDRKPGWFQSMCLDLLYWTYVTEPGPVAPRKSALAMVEEHRLDEKYAQAAEKIDVAKCVSHTLDFIAGETKKSDFFYMTFMVQVVLKQLEQMQESVGEHGVPHGVSPEVRKAAQIKMAADLETEYDQDVRPRQEFLERCRRDAGGDAFFPDAMIVEPLMDEQLGDKVREAMRATGRFWRKVISAYKEGLLPHPEDLASGQGFFTKIWAGRGRTYRHLVEPVDIANWYFQCKGTETGHYIDYDEEDPRQIQDEFTEDNCRRPGRYLFLQQVEASVFGRAKVQSSLGKARDYKRLFQEGKVHDKDSPLRR